MAWVRAFPTHRLDPRNLGTDLVSFRDLGLDGKGEEHLRRLDLALGALGLIGAAIAAACGLDVSPGLDAPTVDARLATTGSAAPGRSAVPDDGGAPASAPTADEGRAIAVRMECNRCHELPDIAPPPPQKRCVGCHEDIVAGRFVAPPASIAKWKPHVAPLRFAPSLRAAGLFLRGAWIAEYLREPHDLRPGLQATMPRLELDEREARAIATWLQHAALPADAEAQRANVAPEGPADADRGRVLFREKGCNRCHAFSGSGSPPPLPVGADEGRDRALAPDLREARRRLVETRVIPWIVDPASVKPDAAMPRQAVTPGEAADLAAFILRAPLDDARPRDLEVRLPVLERPVTYDEVSARVLHRVCWHCHSQPDFARGDGGPGNTGGFGFAARRVDLSSYESIAAGWVDRDGHPASLFSPVAGGEVPVLLAALLTRRDEEGGRSTTLRGMPLGLPSLSAEEIQLVESWITQGHPR